ncbi:MAG: hypothetical protein ACRC2T_20170 [Thermoguttaceae bacterium]
MKTSFSDNLPHFQLYAPFAKISNKDKDFLYGNQFRLYFVHDINERDLSFSQVYDAVFDIAKYGFRMPFVWYVDNINVNIIPNIIDEAMQINGHAGFSLPSIDESFFRKNAMAPTYASYLRLLTNVFEKYSRFDEVLYPLNIIQRKCLANPSIDFDLFYTITTQREMYERANVNLYGGRLTDFWIKVFLWNRLHILNEYHNIVDANQD